MASDRTRELAKFIQRWRDGHKDGWHDSECCVNELLDGLEPLLDAFERDVRADESAGCLATAEVSENIRIARRCIKKRFLTWSAAQPTPEKERGKP